MKIVCNMNMWLFCTLNKFSYFVMRVCGPRLQHFLKMWPSTQKRCPPLS